MQTLRFLRVDFDLPLKFEHLPRFRGAIANLVGREHILFHHHYQDEQGAEKLLYQYPLIQYKWLYGKGSIVCLNEAIQEIHHLFDGNRQWQLRLGDREVDLRVETLRLHEFTLQIHPEHEPYTYALRSWLALNSENYRRYQATEGLKAKLELLEGILANHLIAFAKGVGWHIPTEEKGRFPLTIEEMDCYATRFKGQKLMAFSLKFKTTLFLPSYIGLGKGVSRGYGMLKFLPDKARGNKRKRIPTKKDES